MKNSVSLGCKLSGWKFKSNRKIYLVLDTPFEWVIRRPKSQMGHTVMGRKEQEKRGEKRQSKNGKQKQS